MQVAAYHEPMHLGFNFLGKSDPRSGGSAPSMRSVRSGSTTGSARTASRYPGTACPPGMNLVRREQAPRAPRFIGDKALDDFVFCRNPAPAAPAPPRS